MPETLTKTRKTHSDDEPVANSSIDPKVVLDLVFAKLGKPHDLKPTGPVLTRACAINQNSFRVQIYTESKMPQLAHTFFVRVSNDGRLISSNPEIVKQYE